MPARDVFLCHASPDKTPYVRPLAEELGRRAVSCWVDEAMIDTGDSIIDALNDGLQLSRYVLVMVTPNLLARRWPRRELNAALWKEVRTGRTVIIPVLAVPDDAWADAFPLLADKLHLRWDEGPPAVADAVAARFDRRPAADWAYEHPRDWTGPVWIRCNPVVDERHVLTLRWGPYLREVVHDPAGSERWSMIHHKIHRDRVTLHVHSEPPAVVTFGQGPSPDVAPNAFNIDEGWTRASGVEIDEAAHRPAFRCRATVDAWRSCSVARSRMARPLPEGS